MQKGHPQSKQKHPFAFFLLTMQSSQPSVALAKQPFQMSWCMFIFLKYWWDFSASFVCF